ncbi:helix-turn-helix transcriptional regulator [Sphingobacterium phlebotomi]|uniref:Helix-turn-helix transcriptional regulator n=1 Tax=Sphingobacterium phlebotomi TaxID=2605433 RepID=A0A5D4H843_9SPHI|nr:helix-turn-helix transcriptional regulator [Sphingobacterium phlebotomi]TYR36704.1 helix-turn-helix transcriptional regulator [Sphingobacterium phlebotomi]
MESFFGKNLRAIRKSLNLSIKRFSELTGVSRATIVNVEQGHTGLKIKTMERLISFTNFTVERVSSPKFKIPTDIQTQLFLIHKNDLAKREYFMKRPKILDAVDKGLIDSDYFKSPREINEIVSYFADMGWKILGTSLQNELKKHPNVQVDPHPTKKNTNVYSRK